MKITGAINEFLNPSDIGMRRGRFKVASEMLHDNFRSMVMIMHNVIVIRAEHDLASHMIEYTALSPHFEVVSNYSETPEYHAQLSSVGGELVDVKWIKSGLESDKPNFLLAKVESSPSVMDTPTMGMDKTLLFPDGVDEPLDKAEMVITAAAKTLLDPVDKAAFIEKFGDQIAAALAKGIKITGLDHEPDGDLTIHTLVNAAKLAGVDFPKFKAQMDQLMAIPSPFVDMPNKNIELTKPYSPIKGKPTSDIVNVSPEAQGKMMAPAKPGVVNVSQIEPSAGLEVGDIVTTQGGGISYEVIPPAPEPVEPPQKPVTFANVGEAFIGDGSEPVAGSGSVVGDDEIPF